MSAIGIGVVGYGYWGPNLVRNFANTDDARIVAVSDLAPERLRSIVRRYPGVVATPDVSELIRMPGVDAVAIATPVDTHYDLALAALRAGKHVLVEKPIAETSEQARHLIEEAARRRLVLMVDHTFVFTAAVQKIREFLIGGEIGDLLYYDSVRVNLGLFQRDVNVVWDLAVHNFAILDHLLEQEPLAVSANGVCHVRGNPENMAYITLNYPGNTIAHIHVNWLAPVKVRKTLIGGSRRMIVYDDLEPSEKLKLYDKGVTVTEDPERIRQLLTGYRAGDMWAPQILVQEALRTEIDHFLACVAAGDTPVTDGQGGLRVVKLLEAATCSLRLRGQPIELAPLRKAS